MIVQRPSPYMGSGTIGSGRRDTREMTRSCSGTDLTPNPATGKPRTDRQVSSTAQTRRSTWDGRPCGGVKTYARANQATIGARSFILAWRPAPRGRGGKPLAPDARRSDGPRHGACTQLVKSGRPVVLGRFSVLTPPDAVRSAHLRYSRNPRCACTSWRRGAADGLESPVPLQRRELLACQDSRTRRRPYECFSANTLISDLPGGRQRRTAHHRRVARGRLSMGYEEVRHDMGPRRA